jgi:UDP-glucose 4-epimerase
MIQLVQAFEEVNNIKIPYEIVDRRPGETKGITIDEVAASN